ncbi:MAG: phosphate ABC transporter ATP-binding protein [Methanobacteriota archaeon]|nr:MAG: phosphate ABC transporter ATP-binding protein [Euryarchaeota archaeon]
MAIRIDTSQIIEEEIDTRNKVEVHQLNAFYGEKQVLFDINVVFPERSITAIIGPSGCGKSTFIRTLNRLHELNEGARIEGKVLLDGYDIYAPEVNPVLVRRKIGMVFQKPNPFPNMTIYDNVVAGLKLQNIKDSETLDEVVERTLKVVGLWDEVANDLKNKRGTDLSGGQQQRLCIARAIAVEPEVILMDEPTASLDPQSTLVIEDLMRDLRKKYTVIAVTHNMQQAARVSDFTMFLYNGKQIEHGRTRDVFEKPKEELTEHYITGRFG